MIVPTLNGWWNPYLNNSLFLHDQGSQQPTPKISGYMGETRLLRFIDSQSLRLIVKNRDFNSLVMMVSILLEHDYFLFSDE